MKIPAEILQMFFKVAIGQILEEFKQNGRYTGIHRSAKPLSIVERRYGPARGTAHRALPDPNPNQRRRTDFAPESKAA